VVTMLARQIGADVDTCSSPGRGVVLTVRMGLKEARRGEKEEELFLKKRSKNF